MDDKKISSLMGGDGKGVAESSENYHIKRAMSCSLATDIEHFFLSEDFPKNLNSYNLCEKWLVRCYWETELMDAELKFLDDDRKVVARGEKKPCYEYEDWCRSFRRRVLRQYETLPSRVVDTYLDTSMRSPDQRTDNIIFSDWSDIAEGY